MFCIQNTSLRTLFSPTTLKAIGKHGEDYAMGRSKVFIRSPKTVFELEELRRKKVEDIATLIQRNYRGWVKRKRVSERVLKVE